MQSRSWWDAPQAPPERAPTRPDSSAPNGPIANANELLGLMQALNEPGPYLLVGWSYGGLVVRTAAAISPASVAGLDLIDAVTPTQYRTFDRAGWTEANQDLDMAAAEKAVADASGGLGAQPIQSSGSSPIPPTRSPNSTQRPSKSRSTQFPPRWSLGRRCRRARQPSPRLASSAGDFVLSAHIGTELRDHSV